MDNSWGQSSDQQSINAVVENTDIDLQIHAKIQAPKINLHSFGVCGCVACEYKMGSRHFRRQNKISGSERNKAYFLWIYWGRLVLS